MTKITENLDSHQDAFEKGQNEITQRFLQQQLINLTKDEPMCLNCYAAGMIVEALAFILLANPEQSEEYIKSLIGAAETLAEHRTEILRELGLAPNEGEQVQ